MPPGGGGHLYVKPPRACGRQGGSEQNRTTWNRKNFASPQAPAAADAASEHRSALVGKADRKMLWLGYFLKALAHGTLAVAIQRIAPVSTKVRCGPFTAERFRGGQVWAPASRFGRFSQFSPAAITQARPLGWVRMMVKLPDGEARTSITAPLLARPMETGASE